MRSSASAHIVLHAKASARLIFSIAVSDKQHAEETFVVRQDEVEIPVRELLDEHGTRLHVADVSSGRVSVGYDATISGTSATPPIQEADLIRYLRQSRYCESDQLGNVARAEFGDLHGIELVQEIRNWVHQQLSYVPGTSRSSDGALHTLISRHGVCRDFAHLNIALLRAMDIPARLVSTYAPGVTPMDFHAVTEAFIDGSWHVFDSTGRAPRQTLMRIATGRDAADTAWLTAIGGQVNFGSLTVNAQTEGLPVDDHLALVNLSA
ncbi:transglutaminase family protein [Aurantimicrobium sp. INA4]|uniref:transglutaminase-like domain-containing protein n=1 Tax=Aurantimicrobium sp. INA4 TaxID=2986279 RepID=UPI00248F787A|nr:transglutaminase family protein [Aurantimicrobium sp. INA4]